MAGLASLYSRSARRSWAAALLLAVAAATAGGEVVSQRLAYAHAPVDNPLKGLVPYAGDVRARFPHSMEFNYVPLAALVTGRDQYDWAPLERLLNDIAGRGHQAVFRVYLEFPGRTNVIPPHLVREGLKVHAYTNTNTQPFPPAPIETPDYSDPNLRQCLRRFVAELGRKYDGDPRIGFITAGLLGTWGEWHTYPRDDLWASKDVQTEVLDAYEAAFRITPVLLRYPAGSNHWAQAANAGRRFGYHDDSFAWATLETGQKGDDWFFLAAMKAAGPEACAAWKRAPIGGEIRPEAWGKVFDAAPADSHIQDFARCVEETHVTWLMDSGLFQRKTWSPARRARAEDQVRRMGYEFHVSAVTLKRTGRSLALALSVENRGVAPFYYDWPIEIALLMADGRAVRTAAVAGRLPGLLPGEPAAEWTAGLDLQGVAPGTYHVALRIPNPLRGGMPIRFANKTQDQHAPGWLTLLPVTVPEGGAM